MSTRFDTLKSQLETLSFENLQTRSIAPNDSLARKRSLIQKDAERKCKEHSELKRTYTELTQTTLKQEEIQRTQLQELEVQLDVILTQKRRERANLRRQSERIQAQIETYKDSVGKIEKQIQTLEEKAEKVTSLMKDEQNTRLEAFKSALKPLEDTQVTIQEERKNLELQRQNLMERLQGLDGNFSLKSESILELKKKKQESIANKEKVKKALEEIKKKHHTDYKIFFQEIETKEILTTIKDKKAKQTSTIKEADQTIAVLDAEIERANNELIALENDNKKNPQTSRSERELAEIEKLLALKCKDLQARNLKEVVAQVCEGSNFNVSQNILKEQFKIVEAKEFDMMEEWKLEEEQMEAKIQEMKKLADEQEGEILCMISADQSDPALENMLRDMQNALAQMREEAEKARRRYRCKMAVIGQWKNQNRSVLLSDSPSSLPSDSEISKAFKKQIQQSAKSQGEITAIESIFTNYINKVCQREDLMGRDSEDLNEKESRIGEQKEKLAALKGRRLALQTEKDTLQKEFLKILLLEKAAIKKFENAKAEVEVQRKKKIDEAVSVNFTKSNQEIANIQKTYGDKALKKLRDQELKSMNENQKKCNKEVRKKLEEVQLEMQHWDNEIERLEKSIEDHMTPEVLSIEEEISTLKKQINSIKEQDQILAEAELDVEAKLESLMDSKRIDITRNLQKIVLHHGGEVDLGKLDKLKKNKEKKEEAIDQLEHEIEIINKDFSEKITIVEVEEAKIKARVNQIQEELINLQQDKQKANVLIKKLKISQKEIEQLGIQEEDVELYMERSAMLKPKPQEERKGMTRSQSLPRIRTDSLDKSREETFEEEENKKEEDVKNVLENIESQENEISPIEAMNSINETEINPVNENASECSESKFKFNYKDLTKAEIAFLENIKPLLEGSSLYKRLSQRNSLQFQEFDALDPENPPPENCGYQIRNFSLLKHLNKIEIRRPNKPGIESNILIDQILDVVLPKHTVEILKAKKKLLTSNDELLDSEAAMKKYLEMKETGHINYFDPCIKVLSESCDCFPFFVTLDKGGRVELIADSYSTYRIWVDGIQALIKFKKQLGRLKYKIISD